MLECLSVLSTDTMADMALTKIRLARPTVLPNQAVRPSKPHGADDDLSAGGSLTITCPIQPYRNIETPYASKEIVQYENSVAAGNLSKMLYIGAQRSE